MHCLCDVTAIGIGDQINLEELEGIASPGSVLRRRSVMTVGTFNQLRDYVKIACVDTPTTPIPTTPITTTPTPTTVTMALTTTYDPPPGKFNTFLLK